MTREEKHNETPRKEKMQEALAHYDEIDTKACWHRSDIPEAIRAYYASPSSATAEEIKQSLDELIERLVPINAANFEFCVKQNFVNGGLLQGIRNVATLHAQRIADKKYADTEADGYVFCGKCGKMKEI